jgi:hypothetical protein
MTPLIRMRSVSFWTFCVMEYRAVARSRDVLGILFGGILMYAVLYNYMYSREVVRGQCVAVVDEDFTAASRMFVRRLSATPQVGECMPFASLPDARQALQQGRVSGILVLPHGFSDRLGQGRPPLTLMWGTTASLLTYAAVQEAVTSVGLSLLNAAPSPVTLEGLALYNATAGYGTYLIPAVLMVILFQTLLMAVAMRQGQDATEGYRRYTLIRRLIRRPQTEAESIHPDRRRSLRRLVVFIVGSRLTVFLGLYAVMAFFLVGCVPRLFGLPTQAGLLPQVLLIGAYLLATISFAQALAPWCRDPQGPLVCIAFFSVGYLFLSGISYPLEDMPAAWQIVRMLFPVCPATLAFVQTNTMGATVGEISSQLLVLLLQAKVYISVAGLGHYWLMKKRNDYDFLKNNAESKIKTSF